MEEELNIEEILNIVRRPAAAPQNQDIARVDADIDRRVGQRHAAERRAQADIDFDRAMNNVIARDHALQRAPVPVHGSAGPAPQQAAFEPPPRAEPDGGRRRRMAPRNEGPPRSDETIEDFLQRTAITPQDNRIIRDAQLFNYPVSVSNDPTHDIIIDVTMRRHYYGKYVYNNRLFSRNFGGNVNNTWDKWNYITREEQEPWDRNIGLENRHIKLPEQPGDVPIMTLGRRIPPRD